MRLPLTQWTIEGENLPERLLDAPKTEGFSLPGADALSAFADLIGEEEQKAEAETSGAGYASGGFFEEDLEGRLTLSREIDFGAFAGDRALLTFAYLAGKGEIWLGDACIARFGEDRQADLRHAYALTGIPCALAVDVSDALLLGRQQTLKVCFDEARPAGVVGAAFLCVTARAHLSHVSIAPDALRRTMTVRARVCAQRAGKYVLRVQEIPGEPGKDLPSARETQIELGTGEEKGVQLSLCVDAPAFVCGQAYAAPALKIQLFAAAEKKKRAMRLCDDTLLMCGYGAIAPRSHMPLTEKESLGDPQALCARLCELGVYAVSLSAPAPDALYIEMTRAGIAAVQHVSEEIRALFTRYPCLTLKDAPLQEKAIGAQAAAWQMTGSVAFPRVIDESMTEQEMLLEASGRELDGDSQTVMDALSWLRTVQIRMRAEAARQGRFEGAICCAGEWESGDVRDALHTAFAPVHLSALPLSGAWWTGTQFSAALEAFIPKEMVQEICASAILEDEDGNELARFDAPCKRSGYVGVVEARLGDQPCVLTLRCALTRGEDVLEESVMPIYVGDRGPLEAAF